MQANVGVVDPEALEQYGPEDNRAAVGCGPYYIDNYISGEGFTLKANANYYNPDKIPSIETVNFVVMPEENTMLIAFLNGEIDAISTLNIEVYNSLIDAGSNVVIAPDRANPFWFNPRENPIFEDRIVREALCHLIDWQAVSELVYDGLFPVPDSIWAGPGAYPYGDNYAFDIELGLSMLEDAGYSKDDIAFTFTAAPDYLNMIVAIQAQLQELGFNNIDVETYDASTTYGILKSGTYEILPMHNGYGTDSPLSPYSMGLPADGSQRVMWLDYMDGGARYEEALEVYKAAETATNFEDYLAGVEDLTRICQEENIALGALQFMRIYGINDRFDGIYIPPVFGYFDFCYIWDTQA